MSRRINTFGKRGGGGRRDGERSQVGLPTEVTSLTTRHRALLIDISSTGARVRIDDPPSMGSEVFMNLGHRQLFARIVWRRGEWCGLRFDQELQALDVHSVKQEATLAGQTFQR